MSKRGRVFYLVVFIITTALLSILFSEIYIRVRYGKYIEQTYINSEEAIKAIERLDSTYNGT